MNVLVVGSGAREHAVAWKLRQSPRLRRLYVAPGNAGTATIAENLPIAATDVASLARTARDLQIDLTFVGPEAPLAEGIVDTFRSEGLPIVGPTQAAARIESSKVFAKDLMLRYGIPTAQAHMVESFDDAREYLFQQRLPVVVKADGLAQGKGVFVCQTYEEAIDALHQCLEDRAFGPSGDQVLVEECLQGREVSVFAFTDGSRLSPLVSACDYKRVRDGDLGPNTGGMGSYSPPGFWDRELEKAVRERIMEPTVAALAREGTPFQGTLYAGLMLTRDGPKVLEFNCRLGDPETQAVLPRLATDLLDVAEAVAAGGLDRLAIQWDDRACVGVVMASGGYPGEYRKGLPIAGLARVDSDALVFHAGTRLESTRAAESARPAAGGSRVLTEGGRVLTVTGCGRTLEEARKRAYDNVARIDFEGVHYRGDIAGSPSV